MTRAGRSSVLLLVLAALALSFVPRLLSATFTYNRWDNFEYHTPILLEVHGHLLDGVFPRINFHQHLGEPLPSNIQSGVFCPPP